MISKTRRFKKFVYLSSATVLIVVGAGATSNAADLSSKIATCVSKLILIASHPVRHLLKPRGILTMHTDLSLSIKPGMLRFPDDPNPRFDTQKVPYGDGKITLSEIHLGVHLGTHVDAPAHFIDGGMTVDKIPVHIFLGEVYVLDLSSIDGPVTREILKTKAIPENAKIFIKTQNSNLLNSPEYAANHVYLESDAANYLVERKTQLLGFDYYNIDSTKIQTLDAHMVMAKAKIPVIVAVDMSNITEGRYAFSALPLSLNELEASPVRVVLWKK